MPRFYIDIFDGDLSHRDQTGSEVLGIGQARSEAINTLLDLFRTGLDGNSERTVSTVVRDGRGVVLYEASLTFTIARNG